MALLDPTTLQPSWLGCHPDCTKISEYDAGPDRTLNCGAWFGAALACSAFCALVVRGRCCRHRNEPLSVRGPVDERAAPPKTGCNGGHGLGGRVLGRGKPLSSVVESARVLLWQNVLCVIPTHTLPRLTAPVRAPTPPLRQPVPAEAVRCGLPHGQGLHLGRADRVRFPTAPLPTPRSVGTSGSALGWVAPLLRMVWRLFAAALGRMVTS